MKKIIYSIVIVAIALSGIYYYITRPVSAPSVPQTEVVAEMASSYPTYTIGTGSVAEFRIGEELRGKPFMVVGVADMLSGTITLSESQTLERVLSIGEIKVNARTFKTDSTQRDGAIARAILKSENPEYEFIVFTPTEGAEIAVTPDGSFSDSLSGTLTIAGISKPATFKITGTASADSLAGLAETTITRSDFGLTIPNIPFVANVDETIAIKVTIVAPAK